MPREIEISDEVTDVINRIGGTFDTPDDVLRQILREAGYEVNGETEQQDWSEDEFESYFRNTSSPKQKIFIESMVEYGDDWLPKRVLFDRYEEQEIETSTHIMTGVQGPMTTRCGDREKFWESDYQGERVYRIKPEYLDVVQEVLERLWH